MASENEPSRLGPIARFFGSLTNALLDVGLPAIRAWLRERVGPDADIAQITNEGAYVHLDSVRIPVGPRGIVVLERATAKIVSPTKIRIHEFRGGLAFGTDGESSFVADVVFTSTADADDAAWVSGDLEIKRASWTNREGRANPPMSGAARLFVSESTWRLESAELRGEQAVARFSGNGDFDRVMPVAVAGVALEKCRVGPFVDAAGAIAGKPFAVPAGVPLDALLEGMLSWEAARGGECNLHVLADAGSVTLSAAVTPDGKTVRGRIEATLKPHVPLRAAGLGKWAPREEDAILVAVDIEGETSAPRARGTIRAGELGFRFGRPRFMPAAVLRALEGSIEGEGDALRVRIGARAGDGSLEIDAHGTARDPSSLRGNVRAEGVDGAFLKGILPALGVPLTVPPDLRVSVDLGVGEWLALEGRGRLVSPRTDIAMDPLVIRAGETAGTRAKGRLAAADLLATGVLDFVVRPDPVGELAIEIAMEDGNVAKATAKIPEVRLRYLARSDVGPFVLADVQGRLALDTTSFRYEDVTFRAYGGRFALRGTIPFGADEGSAPRLVARVDEADGSLATAIASFARVAPELPAELRVSGETTVHAGGALECDVGLETPKGTALLVYGRMDRAQRLDGSRVKGVVALEDVLTVASAAQVPLRAHVRIDADVSGAAADAALAGFVVADRIDLAGAELTDATALFHADGRRLVWNDLEASAYDGSVVGAGIMGYGPAFSELIASVVVRAVAVEKLPAAAGALTGRLSGSLDLVSGRALSGHGMLRLESPAYPVLENARPALHKYGLVPPPTRGIVPATATIELASDGIHILDLRAAVTGCSVTGEALVGFAGSLRAAATVTLEDDFLASSPMLVVPKVLAERLTLPVRIGGTIAAPVVKADLGACLGKLARDNRVSAFVTGAVEEVALLLGKDRGDLPSETPSPRDPARAHEDVAARLESLLASAADWTTLAARLEDHKSGGSRLRVSG